MAGTRWSSEEEMLLLKHWHYMSKDELVKLLPSRTYASILLKAGKLSLKKSREYYNTNIISGNISKLLEENNVAYYWTGFIIADGNIHNNRLSVTLAAKDKDHLSKLSSFIEYKNELSYTKIVNAYKLSVMDKVLVKAYADKFDIKDGKTYNPPNISISNKNYYYSMMIGYTDGDGTIGYQSGREDVIIRYQVHKSTYHFLCKFCDILSEDTKIDISKPFISGNGYCILNIANYQVISFLKRKALELNIPYLNRKWDKIKEGSDERFFHL